MAGTWRGRTEAQHWSKTSAQTLLSRKRTDNRPAVLTLGLFTSSKQHYPGKTFCGTLYSQYSTIYSYCWGQCCSFCFKITGIYLHDILNNLQICVHSLMDILHSCPHPAPQLHRGGSDWALGGHFRWRGGPASSLLRLKLKVWLQWSPK